jgi:hypothetical protein
VKKRAGEDGADSGVDGHTGKAAGWGGGCWGEWLVRGVLAAERLAVVVDLVRLRVW